MGTNPRSFIGAAGPPAVPWGWAGRGAGAGGLVVRAVMLGGSRGAQTKAESFPPHCWEEVEKQEETWSPGQAETWCLWQGFQRSHKGC